MRFVKISKQTWSCLFFHVWRFPGLGVVGNKFGTICVNVSALSNSLHLMHKISSSWLFQKWTPQKWVSSWRIPCTLCASWALFPLILPIFPPFSPSCPFLCVLLFLSVLLSCQFSTVKVKPLLNAILYSRGWAGVVSSDSWCWQVTWVTAEPNPSTSNSGLRRIAPPWKRRSRALGCSKPCKHSISLLWMSSCE